MRLCASSAQDPIRAQPIMSLKSICFVKFVAIGGMCAITNIGFIWFATEYWQLHYLISIASAFLTINAAGYALNKYFTFNRSDSPLFLELGTYYRVMFTSMLMGLLAMFVLVDIIGLHYLAAAIMLTGALTLRNFVMHRDRTFK